MDGSPKPLLQELRNASEAVKKSKFKKKYDHARRDGSRFELTLPQRLWYEIKIKKTIRV